ncbi:helix-turn-helix domain-containing protein [Patescibacteria group bacterium]
MSDISTVLKQLSLNDKEIEIYLALIQSGPASVQNISRSTSISRSTVYQRLENLQKAGLVNFEFGGKGKVVKATQPDKLKEIIENRVEDSKKLANDFSDILPELSNLYQPTTTKAKVMYFEGVEGLKRQIMNYDMEAKSKDLYGFATMSMVPVLGRSFIVNVYHKKFWTNGYRDHYVMSDCKENLKFFKNVKTSKLYVNKRIFVKKLSKKVFNPKVNVAIYDDKYSVQLMKEGKPFGVLIQNKEIANHQMELFNIAWKAAKEI